MLCGDIISHDVLIWKASQCFKAGSHICWLVRKGKERDFYQKSKPSDEKNIDSSKSHFLKLGEMYKISQKQSCSKSLMNTITNNLNLGDRKVDLRAKVNYDGGGGDWNQYRE